jgi:hypothetical protein
MRNVLLHESNEAVAIAVHSIGIGILAQTEAGAGNGGRKLKVLNVACKQAAITSIYGTLAYDIGGLALILKLYVVGMRSGGYLFNVLESFAVLGIGINALALGLAGRTLGKKKLYACNVLNNVIGCLTVINLAHA